MSRNKKGNVGGRFGPRPKSGSSTIKSAGQSTSKSVGESTAKNIEKSKEVKKQQVSQDAFVLKDFYSIDKDQQLVIKELLSDLRISGDILGVINSKPKIFSPVIHEANHRYPVIIKLISHNNKLSLEDQVRFEKNLREFANLEVAEYIFNEKTNNSFLKRTYSLNTLQDALNSSITISLSEVLRCLKKTLERLLSAHSKGIIHGHVHPGNICFKMDLSGDLLDGGISHGKNSKTAAGDVFGFGRTLQRILNCPSIICDQSGPSREEILAVFNPVIESATRNKEEERITLESLSSIYFDFLPMLSLDEEEVAKDEIIESNVEEETESNNLVFDNANESDLFKDENDNLKVESNDKQNEEESFDDFSDFFKDEVSDRHSFVTEKSYVQAEEMPSQVNSTGEINGFEFINESNEQKIIDNKQSQLLPNLIRFLFLGALLLIIFWMANKLVTNLKWPGSSGVQQEKEIDVYLGDINDTEVLSSAWESGVISQMKLVADQAVYQNPGRMTAERVILASVTNGSLKSDYVDTGLLRVAFSNKWEEQLNEDDRRYALSLGLIQLLKNKLPQDLGKIEDRHPAVLLALMSSGSSGVSKFLASVPVVSLEKLPAPYGPAFQLLSAGKSGKTCGDEDVISLARLGARGVENQILVSQFLREDFRRRMSALAILFSSQTDNARKVLDIVLRHPNLSLSNPELIWAKKVSLIDWKDVDPGDQLFLVAGVPLRGNTSLTPQSVAKLFLNPSERVRGYAAGLALNKITFLHKGAPEILEMVKNAPDILSQDQFIMLGQILEDPKKTAETHRKIVHNFIASNPPVEIAKHLLIASATESESTILDSALGIYLGEKKWIPNKQDLEILINHPDKVSRMFAYQNIFSMLGTSDALILLKKAYPKENDSEYKKQLKEMISKLEPNQGK